VFINHRRDDAHGYAGEPRDSLTRRLVGDNIFIDIDDIKKGEDYAAAIDRAIAGSNAVLVRRGR
jgi:hypothetical protein